MAIAALAIASQPAIAQDRSSRGDAADFRQRVTGPPSESTLKRLGLDQAAEDTGWAFRVLAPATFATNPAQSPTGTIQTVYATPTFRADYTAPASSDGWSILAKFIADADFAGRRHRDIDEARLTANVAFQHPTPLGVVSMGLRGRSSFSSGYHNYFYTRGGPVVGLVPTFGESLGLELEAEYRFSDDPTQRRTVVTGIGTKTWPIGTNAGGRKIAVRFDQEVRFSAYEAGLNSKRRDVRSSSSLTLDPALFSHEDYIFEITATFYHNFSNQRGQDFSDFEIGPTLTIKF